MVTSIEWIILVSLVSNTLGVARWRSLTLGGSTVHCRSIDTWVQHVAVLSITIHTVGPCNCKRVHVQ